MQRSGREIIGSSIPLVQVKKSKRKTSHYGDWQGFFFNHQQYHDGRSHDDHDACVISSWHWPQVENAPTFELGMTLKALGVWKLPVTCTLWFKKPLQPMVISGLTTLYLPNCRVSQPTTRMKKTFSLQENVSKGIATSSFPWILDC